MKKEETVQELRDRFKDADTSGVEGVVAVQVDLRDEDGGTLYLEVKDKVLSIEPYEYYDRNVILNVLSSDLLDIIDKKLDPSEAISKGILTAEGDFGKALVMLSLSKPKIEKKPEVKEEEKVEEKTEIKPESKPVPKATTKTTSKSKPSTKTSAKAASKTTSKSKTKVK